MKTNKIVGLFLTGLSIMTTIAFVGATAGTLAWYAYVTRASVSYKGVSINSTEQLQVGIRDDATNPRIVFDAATLAAHNCVRDGNIVWANPGSNIDQTIISGYLSRSTNATYVNSLFPVTTKSRDLTSTSDIKLYSNPTAQDPKSTKEIGEELEYYVRLPLVFRVLDNDSDYIANKKVWLSRASAKMIGNTGKDITGSLRVFSDDGAASNPKRYLINPSQANNGETVVAGILDLNGDGYYDTGIHDSMLDHYETVYGTYEGTPTYTGRITGDTGYTDINSTGMTGNNGNSFYSKHRDNNHILNDYNGLTLGTAGYYGMSVVAPTFDPVTGGYGESGKPLSITDSTSKIASVYLTIYLEGWDHAVIDEAVGCRFNLGLTFEIE